LSLEKEKKKQNFIEFLTQLKPKEINDLIEQKGKKPKPVKLVSFLK